MYLLMAAVALLAYLSYSYAVKLQKLEARCRYLERRDETTKEVLLNTHKLIAQLDNEIYLIKNEEAKG